MKKDLTSLLDEVRRLEKERTPFEDVWKLNLAFYKGKQYVYLNPKTRRIESLITEDFNRDRQRVRITSNQIAPGVQSLVARLNKTKPVVSATPNSSDTDDVLAAQVAEGLLEYWDDQLDIPTKNRQASTWAGVTGNGFLRVGWDKDAGDPIKFTVGPDGEPITNPSLKTIFYNQLEQQGIDPYGHPEIEKVLYTGDIKIDVLSPFEVLLPMAKSFADLKHCYCVHAMEPDEIKAKYKFKGDLTPDCGGALDYNTVSTIGPATQGPDAQKMTNTHKKVYYGYFVPCGSDPKGRYVVFLKNPDTILYDSDWPYPIKMIPIVKFPGIMVPGQVWDTSCVEQAIPLQKDLNRTLSQIVEFKNKTVSPKWIAPAGSMPGGMSNDPGIIDFYNPVANLKPEMISMPPMQGYIFTHLQTLVQDIKAKFFLQEQQDGKVAPNVDSGIAIELMQEMSAETLAPMVNGMEEAIERLGKICLAFAQKYYEEPRLISIIGASGISQAKYFSRADLGGGVSIHTQVGSGMPRTNAGKQARILQLTQLGMLEPRQAWKYTDIGDLKSLQSKFKVNEDQAIREHEKMLSNQPVNPLALQSAMQQAQQPDPQTGMPIDPNQAQAMVMQAGLSPHDYDDDAAHLDVHLPYAKSVEFEGLPLELQQNIVVHIQLHQKRLSEAHQDPAKPPNINLQLKGAVTPSVGAAILDRGGVEGVPKEAFMEPPVDTWVVDNQDKPNSDDAINYGAQQIHDMALAEAQHEQEMQQSQDKHQMDMVSQLAKLAAQKQQGGASGSSN